MGREASFVHEENIPSSLTAPLAILGALLASFALIALFMVHDHTWTDEITAHMPWPGQGMSLAADPSLEPQMRMINARAWNTILADQTPTLMAEADIVNDALVPVERIMVRAEARTEGRTKAVATAVCGKSISTRLLGRIGRDEIETLMSLDAPLSVEPGHTLACQVAFPGVVPGVEEVVIRIASVEPSPGHHPPVFRPE
jgi:hypothetical protein